MKVTLIFNSSQPVKAVAITTIGFEGLYIISEDNQGTNSGPTQFDDNAYPTPVPLDGDLVEFPQLTVAMVGVTCDATKVVSDNNGSKYLLLVD